MERIVIFLSLAIIMQADINSSCIACHNKNKIPSELIYKRYLMKYSTKKNIEDAIYSYLTKPNPKYSIMPSAFFNKFPIKKAINGKNLRKDIKEFINMYDISKKLVLQKHQ